MSDGDLLKALSSQYESRATLLVEILKMYVHLMLVFAVAVFACLGLLVKLSQETQELGIDWLQVANLTDQVLRGAILLSPVFVLAWFAGNLFLRWNYDVVIKEMDRISSMLANEMGLSNEEAKNLKHERFLDAYAYRRFWPVYVIIASPVILAFLVLAVRGSLAVVELCEPWNGWWGIALGVTYGVGLAALAACCFYFNRVFRENIKKKL